MRTSHSSTNTTPYRAVTAERTTWTTCNWYTGGATMRTMRGPGTGRQRLEPYDEQSSRPVLRGLGLGNEARLPDNSHHPSEFLRPGSLMWLEGSASDLTEPWGWVGLKRWRRRFGPTLPHGFLRKTRSSARGWRYWWRRRWTFAASTSWSWPPPCRARPSGWTCATNGSAGCSATRASMSKP